MNKIQVYSRVALELISQDYPPEVLEVILVPDHSADLARGLMGETTPLAKLVLGRQEGEELPYRQGDLVAVRILSVTVDDKFDPASAARQTAEKTARIALDVAADNAAVFAASFSGKWGDYDPDGVKKWKENQTQAKDADHGKTEES